ncbi:ABC transporter ATP-binding protein [Paenibacillus apiarius]|uniref:ABC transporter ATP-binding protein n=1 Tax=Paenibacillus apiarius TaxID=46240 RepID=A0ABT4DTT6_9BACL|nr:ABC transporter ATP-binding protein [Paenibacillus apiarius]MCY9515837.1 ABC transporter ATP-binding protein [Paenibacillus apiarius]MCY9520747.1 ABC transporter ATP-binding protein [Paenibacillus apiarius]MCY9553451.1 ABC transporter ATP-binding protein [Paenibacillus apiarius]MCY9558025.1 ABC transporter ATP-binding protein [Paenibacillus apiarius]MCY9685880.1 ABC transporter ATP-binding protein [Paenibacillus apiarius]
MIQIYNVNKSYGKNKQALKSVHLEIGHGMFGLLGPNGAGKSTLLRMLATLLKPTSGTITIDGCDLAREADTIRRMIGYLPQSFQAHPQMTGRQFLDYVAIMKGISSGKERKRHVDELLEQVNLADKASLAVRTYSGGMRQRIGIAQALIGSPQVLIVDEPTAGLDPEERVRFRNLLNRFSLERTVILSTHIVGDIETSCTQLAVMLRGEVRYAGHPQSLAKIAEGQVWEAELSDSEFTEFEPSRIVGAKRTATGVRCRMLSSSPPVPDAVSAVPTMEDGYLALIGGERRE